MEKITYKKQYLEWLKNEKRNGLKSIHFSLNENFKSDKLGKEKEEEFYKNLMEFINAPVKLPEIVSIYKDDIKS